MDFIPVHRPQLPSSHLIMPYLKRIDEARWYSNFGPLVNELEAGFAKHFDVTPEMVTTAVNGTLMLIAMLKALNLPEKSYCIMPSWTFVATASAAHYAGLIPYFVDVDRDTQALDPAILKSKLPNIDGSIGAVIVIAPFGCPINIKGWEKFTEETHIPVIIDAAAGFDTVARIAEMSVSHIPIMISLHATKVFGIGEGGLALSKNRELIRRIKSMTGFGFDMHREALLLGLNAKLPEYTAAVGLAALDSWTETRRKWENIRDQYRIELANVNLKSPLSVDWVSSTCNVIVPNQAEFIAKELKEAGIDTRKWWLNGCHQHYAYQHYPREKNLTNTEWLSQSVLGLPFAIDLDENKVKYICRKLRATSDAVNCCVA